MNGYSQDIHSGLYYSPKAGGVWYNPSTGDYFSIARGTRSKSDPTLGPANACDTTAPSTFDADTVLSTYLALPKLERLRFVHLVDNTEEGFTRDELKTVKDAPFAKKEFYRWLVQKTDPKDDAPANGPRKRGHIRGSASRPANGLWDDLRAALMQQAQDQAGYPYGVPPGTYNPYAAYPPYPPYNSAPAPAYGGVYVPPPPPAPVAAAPAPVAGPNYAAQFEGQALRGDNGDPTIWKVENGVRRGFTTPASYLAAGFKPNQELVLPMAIVNSIPLGPNMP